MCIFSNNFHRDMITMDAKRNKFCFYGFGIRKEKLFLKIVSCCEYRKGTRTHNM